MLGRLVLLGLGYLYPGYMCFKQLERPLSECNQRHAGLACGGRTGGVLRPGTTFSVSSTTSCMVESGVGGYHGRARRGGPTWGQPQRRRSRRSLRRLAARRC